MRVTALVGGCWLGDDWAEEPADEVAEVISGIPSLWNPKDDQQALEKTMGVRSEACCTVRRQCVSCLQRRGPVYSVP